MGPESDTDEVAVSRLCVGGRDQGGIISEILGNSLPLCVRSIIPPSGLPLHGAYSLSCTRHRQLANNAREGLVE